MNDLLNSNNSKNDAKTPVEIPNAIGALRVNNIVAIQNKDLSKVGETEVAHATALEEYRNKWESGKDVKNDSVQTDEAGQSGTSGDTVQTEEVDPLDKMPAIKTWKTSVGLSVAGALCGIIVGQMFLTAFLGILGAVIYLVVKILYALICYRSYFTSEPYLKSSKAISFWNSFFGWWLGFGFCMNGCLTKSRNSSSKIMGASYIGLVIVAIISLVFVLLPFIR